MSLVTSRALSVCIGSLLAATAVVNDASAQPRPGTVQPGQVERQFERPPEPTVRDGVITIPGVAQQVPPNADTIKFVLNQLTIDGATVYPADKLRTFYAGSIRKEVSLGDIYRIVETLTAKYRNDGYILSQVIVPAQAVEGGNVRVQAIEGYIANVRVEGGSESMRGRIQKYGERIRDTRPLTIASLERNVLLMNDLPGVQARAVLAPAQTPGASDLVLQVSQRPVAAQGSADSRGSRAQGRQRVFGDLDMHSLFGGASLTEVRDVTTFDRELNYVAVSHDQFVGARGGKFSVAGSYVYSKPQELSIIPLHLTTESETLGLTYSYPLLRRRATNLYVRGSVTAFNSKSTIFDVRDTEDRIRAARVGFTYDAGDGLGGVNIVDVEYSHGINGLGSSRNGDEYLSRSTGRVDFSHANLYASRIQALPANLSIVAAVNGQYAFTDQLAPELFAFGGEMFGRGYDASELLNDHGVAAKLDLRYLHNWGRSLLMPYGFVDWGQLWQRTRFAGIDDTQTATSAGFGIRVGVRGQLSSFIEFAKPLNRDVGQENNRDPRIFAGVSIQ
jgi:hemolysin activation/secretion protein